MGACCFKPTSQTSEENEVQADNNHSSDGGRRPHRTNRPTGEGELPVLQAGVDRRTGPGPGNKLLCRKPPVWNADHPMTRGQLLSKRDEFWDTAPAFNGKPEIWQVVEEVVIVTKKKRSGRLGCMVLEGGWRGEAGAVARVVAGKWVEGLKLYDRLCGRRQSVKIQRQRKRSWQL